MLGIYNMVNKKHLANGGQRFDKDDAEAFVRSLFDAKTSEKELAVPTYVALAGGTFAGPLFPYSNRELDKLKGKWEKLGADVELHPNKNHWYSGGKYKGEGEWFSEIEEDGVADKIKYFLNQRPDGSGEDV